MTIRSRFTSPSPALRGVIGALAFASLTAACTAQLGVAPPVVYGEAEADIIYVETVPVNIETYPHESYRGGDVYLVDGRWYRRHGDRWASYRTEPVELGRRRVVIERRSRRHPPEERRERR